MTLVNLIKPLGMITYILAIVTLSSGLLRKKFKFQKWIKFHLTFAIVTITSATIHLLFVLLSQSK